jgi:hypothetical protein
MLEITRASLRKGDGTSWIAQKLYGDRWLYEEVDCEVIVALKECDGRSLFKEDMLKV